MQVDCIVRFHDIRRLTELERCVFSLVGQHYRPLHIILVLQRFSPAEVEATRGALAPLFLLPSAPKLSVHNWNEDGIADARTHLLNRGVELADGRYLAFLDYDDVLFPEAYATLVTRLREQEAAIAFASVKVMRIEPYDHFFYTIGPGVPSFNGKDLMDLFRSNFCPIHSYLIDRGQVSSEILVFDTSLIIEEDYDLLLKICAQCPSDFSLVGTYLGYYFYKTDGSNTVGTEARLDEKTLATHRRVQAIIQNRKESTRLSSDVLARLGLSNLCEPVSINDLLQRPDERSPA